MCTRTIIDTSVFGKLNSPRMKPFWNWMNRGHGIIVYTDGGKYYEELRKAYEIAYQRFLSYRQSGLARLFEWDQVREYESALSTATLRSNDPHIAALAQATDTLILCTFDGDLKGDFLNRDLLPPVKKEHRAVYPSGERRKQQDFLRRRECPLRSRTAPSAGRRRSR